MKHVMLDLETMGTRPDAAIVAIGAVEMYPETSLLGSEFYDTISLSSSVKLGGTIDPATVIWWLRQNEHCRREIFSASQSIETILDSFAKFLLDAAGKEDITVWGNGSDFDNVILRSAYERAGMPPPWSFRNNGCYRTLKNLYPNIPFVQLGLSHKAIDDAVSQASHWLRIMENNSERRL